MKNSKVNLATILDTRRKRLDEKYPIKLRVTFQRKRKYYGTGQEATRREWEKLNTVSVRGRLKSIKNCLTEIEETALAYCDEVKPFSFQEFETAFFDTPMVFPSVSEAVRVYIDKLEKEDRYKTASSFKAAITALEKYKPNLKFEDIDTNFLFGFEHWMTDRGRSLTTVGIYLRSLRVILNQAKEKGIIQAESYPFGRGKYIIPTGKNIKKALSKAEIKKIFEYQTLSGDPCDKAKDFWLFSYLCNGINMADIAYLKWSDLTDKTIVFERNKTKRTKRDKPVKIVALRDQYKDEIIRKWGCPGQTYLFGVIKESDSPKERVKKIAQFIQTTNKWMKRIGEDLNINLKLTTYVARHSFATILVRGGAPLEMASQLLGHSSLLTTQKYFAGFELSKQAEFTKTLMDF